MKSPVIIAIVAVLIAVLPACLAIYGAGSPVTVLNHKNFKKTIESNSGIQQLILQLCHTNPNISNLNKLCKSM